MCNRKPSQNCKLQNKYSCVFTKQKKTNKKVVSNIEIMKFLQNA